MAARSAHEGQQLTVRTAGRPGHSPTAGGRAVHAANTRGRYFTLRQAADEYPAFTLRLLRRLVQERRIAFSRAGRCIVLAEADIEAYLEASRVEPTPPSCHWHVAS
jgi:hypothetical protein